MVSVAEREERGTAREVSGARGARRGALPRARTPLEVCKPRFGGYARAGARQGAFAVEFRKLNGVFGAFAVLNAFGVPPEARDGRCTLRGAGDAIQLLKRRESARKVRAGAHGDGDHVLRA